ncbi:MAG: phosphoribosylformylglycinamidine synthase [Clostridiales bacterium]|nr:phosphoribosylformylglycinamidine synthase [Clostridiales bacterium]
MVRRIYVEKKKGFDIEARGLFEELKESLELPGLTGVRVLNRYDIEGISEKTYERARCEVFAEPATDIARDEILPGDLPHSAFAVSYLPGQFDQRADSTCQILQLLEPAADILASCAKVVALEGDLTGEEVLAVKKYCINPVDSREVGHEKPGTLAIDIPQPGDIKTIDGFASFTRDELLEFKEASGFAMSDDDIAFVQGYFASEEKRDPTITELRAIDTYWSDHCRHSTFLTRLTDIEFEAGAELASEAFEEYLKVRGEVYGGEERDICLMDIACIGAKHIKKKGLLKDLDESDEVNACSIKIDVDVDGENEDWLLMFKNETHNHPTEIEPFGGASTCLGGAIRDPLSGRAYVYQAMRVTGCGDPRTPVADTLPGKLPQRKITRDAAAGYSSYGNQIGAATGQVTEIYDEGYVAKRMELGAVMAAAPAGNVKRGKPVPGDAIILVGGRTGRDGCGGATSSSKSHTEDSAADFGAEVQKGNPLIERNIVRLFRRKEAATLIKKCNDFGAGGVSVAVGELADSIDANLDLVPAKYDGLDGTELAISESQERMAVVVSDSDKDAFIAYAEEENLEATVIAKVTDTGRFRIFWRGKPIFDISRAFLNTSGVTQEAKVSVAPPASLDSAVAPPKAGPQELLADLNCCSQKGLVEMFDSSAGAAAVLVPLGGKHQLSPALGMAAKIPVLGGETNTATLMAYGYNHKISKASPFHGGMYAVIESITKIIAMGGDMSSIRLTFQEYFEKLKNPESWGKPFAALLGALKAQLELEAPSIGGKDSMSGTFMDLSVPPTLVSFAVSVTDANNIISTEFKKPGSKIVLVRSAYDADGVPYFRQYKENMKKISLLTTQKRILSTNAVGMGGIFIALVKMAAGNGIGFKTCRMEDEMLYKPDCTALVLEISEDENLESMFAGIKYEELGATTEDGKISIEGALPARLEDAIKQWTAPFEDVFPTRMPEFKHKKDSTPVENIAYTDKSKASPKVKIAKPQALITVFQGTSGEYDAMTAFEKAGADVRLHILRNLNPTMLSDSIAELADKIRKSQIVMIPGGSSAGDEPDGSGKFIAAVFRDERIKEAIADLMENRGGLMLGICNGFQALVRLGLVPYGRIVEPNERNPVLARNKSGRGLTCMVMTRVSSVLSPWFAGVNAGDVHTVPASQSEGRFACSEQLVAELIKNGQIAAQYCDFDGNASMDTLFNPNGSVCAIEAVTSPDGRILGKMAHSERIGTNLYKNLPGNYDQKVFESGVRYFGY